MRAWQLFELKTHLDPNHYGGWILPDNSVEYVPSEGHDALLARTNLNWMEAWKDGWVRFVLENYPADIAIEGRQPSLRRTVGMWGPFVNDVARVYIDLIIDDNRGRYKQFVFHVNDPTEKARLRSLVRGELVEMQLNELRELIDPSEYGGWITDKNKVLQTHEPQGHAQILIDAGVGTYTKAYDRGWVRFVTSIHNTLHLSGELEDLQRTFRIWWPTAIQLENVVIDLRRHPISMDIVRPYFKMSNHNDKAELRKIFSQ